MSDHLPLRQLLLFGLVIFATVSPACNEGNQEAMEMSAQLKERPGIREPAVAGQFYPADSKTLSQQVADFLDNVPESSIDGEIVAIISPHAGYVYSGQVAAYAYTLLENKNFDLITVIAPSHRTYFRGISVYPGSGYRTPLGVIPVATDLAQKLITDYDFIDYHPQAHTQEHSLEVQLPFLQMTVRDSRLVPMVMGDCDYQTCQNLARAIAQTLGDKRLLIVASTDLSHFHPYSEAVELDQIVQDHVGAFDPAGLWKDLSARRCEACGGAPMVATMLAAKELGATRSQVLKYANSGDVTGDRSGVVGYMAAAFFAPESRGGRKVGVDLGLSKDEKETLLHLARTTIERRVRGKEAPDVRVDSERLREERGAFVTINKQGNLRGCIGHIQGTNPLYLTVREMAEAAALRDHRFPPVSPDELDDIEVEISVLTPLRKIENPEEIEVGTHGIYMKRGYHSGLLLPQVATDYGWDRRTFLEHTCLKAGLPSDAWKEKETEIYIFSADVFGER